MHFLCSLVTFYRRNDLDLRLGAVLLWGAGGTCPSDSLVASQIQKLAAKMYSVQQKKYPLKFFAIFSATARNFYMKFRTFITHS